MRSSDLQRESWQRLLAECQASGLSASSWCRDNHVDKVKFYYWRKRLAPDSASSGAPAGEPNSPRWLAVGAAETQVRTADSRPGTAAVGLTLRVGRVEVEINAGFDPHLLADVLHVLEAHEQQRC
jgi:hypothetical protein